MKPRSKLKNIRVRFNNQVVTLATEDDRVVTRDNVEIYIEKQPANNFRPMARLLNGGADLEKFKHCRPVTLSFEEVEPEDG